MTRKTTWSAADWLDRYGAATREGWSAKQELRREVFRSTVEILRRGGYDLDDRFVPLAGRKEAWEGTGFSTDTAALVVPDALRGRFRTQVHVVPDESFDAARREVERGGLPAVLNMASEKTPGGGVIRGSGAQEENLFRRSTLLWSLYRFAPWHDEYGVDGDPLGRSYPIPETGGIWSPHVRVFRSSEESGYALLDEPFEVSVISVAAVKNPPTVLEDGEERLTPADAERTLRKIRAILRIGSHSGATTLVLGALGCGAYRNPPRHVARLFHEVLGEPEFDGVFEDLVFAVYDRTVDLEAKDGGNRRSFEEVFGDGPLRARSEGCARR